MRAIFLDKDGTLVEDIPYNADPAHVKFCDGVIEGLQLLQQQGYVLIVVTNQAGIAKGYFDEATFERLRDHLILSLAGDGIVLDGFYYCPHHPQGNLSRYTISCDCRKPLPGMLLRAANEHDIDLSQSWMIGDILNDVEAGRRAGCRTILIDNGNETEWQWSMLRSPDIIVGDLHAAAEAVTLSDRLRSTETCEAIPS